MINRIFFNIIDSIHKNQIAFYSTLLFIVALLFTQHQITLRHQHLQKKTADKFFSLIIEKNFPEEEETLDKFSQGNKGSIYSDLIKLQQAKYYYEQKNKEKAQHYLLGTLKETKSKEIRSLAAYRLAMVLKEEKPKKSLYYLEKTKTKSMRGLKSLLKAEIFEALGEREKAMIELNSIISSTSNNDASYRDNVILIELANQHKRKLLAQNV